MQSITFIKIKYNTEVNTAQYILYVYKLKYDEDQQEEHAYRITHKFINHWITSQKCCDFLTF